MRSIRLARLTTALSLICALGCGAEDPAEPAGPDLAECVGLTALSDAPGWRVDGAATPNVCELMCDGTGEDRYFYFVAPEAGRYRIEASNARLLEKPGCALDDPGPLGLDVGASAVEAIDRVFAAGELLVFGLYTTIDTPDGEVPPPEAYTVQAFHLPEAPAGCEGLEAVYDPSEDRRWSVVGEAWIALCDIGCEAQGTHHYFVAPVDGRYTLHIEVIDTIAAMYLEVQQGCEPGEIDFQRVAEVEMVAGEVITLSAFALTNVEDTAPEDSTAYRLTVELAD